MPKTAVAASKHDERRVSHLKPQVEKECTAKTKSAQRKLPTARERANSAQCSRNVCIRRKDRKTGGERHTRIIDYSVQSRSCLRTLFGVP